MAIIVKVNIWENLTFCVDCIACVAFWNLDGYSEKICFQNQNDTANDLSNYKCHSTLRDVLGSTMWPVITGNQSYVSNRPYDDDDDYEPIQLYNL